MYLHGSGGRGTDNLKQITGGNTSGATVWAEASNQAKYPAFVLAPQAPLQPGAWGYTREDDGKHHTSDEVLGMLANAQKANCNLLLNTGPLPDGSIHHEDDHTLRTIGKIWHSELANKSMC